MLGVLANAFGITAHGPGGGHALCSLAPNTPWVKWADARRCAEDGENTLATSGTTAADEDRHGG